MQSKVVIMSPQQAAAMLGSNDGNRPLRTAHVKRLAEQMTSGKWMLAQPIIVTEDGEIVDGQHRLHAVVRAGISVEMLVVSGVDKQAFAVIDQGVVRTAGDLHGAMGGHNSIKAVAVASAMLTGANVSKRGAVGRADVARYAIEHDDVIQWVQSLFNTKDLASVSTPAVKAAFAKASLLYGKDRVGLLVDRLRTMDFASENDPMKSLYRWLVANTGRKKVAAGYRAGHHVYAATVSAIRAGLEGRELKQVKTTSGDFDDRPVRAL